MLRSAGAGARGLPDGRLEFERLIVDTSAALFAAPPETVERVVEDSLDRVRVFFRADRCALLAVSSDQQAVHVRLAAYGEGVSHVSPAIDLAAGFPWSRDQLLDGHRPVRVSSPAMLPPEAEVERSSWERMPIRSGLMLPVESDGPVTHLIILNTVREERDWPDEFVTRLRVFGEMLVSALQRQAILTELRQAEERVSLAADSAEAGLWILDYSTGVFWTAARTRALFGFSADEIVTLDRLRAAIHPDDWGMVRSVIDGSRRSSELASVEYRITTGGGQTRWMVSRGRSQFDAEGAATGLTGVTIEITERRLAQEALRASQARLEAAVDLAGLAFYEVHFDAGTVYVDDRFRSLCGLPHDAEQGLGPLEFWMDHVHDDDRQRLMDERAKLHDGRTERLSVEYRFLHPTEGEKWIKHVARVSERLPDRRTVKAYGVLRDITQRKQVEAELRDLSRRLIRAQEEERATLARELHDDVSQRLAVLAIDVGLAEMGAKDAAQSEAMRSAREGLIQLSEDVHSLAYQLHPSILEELGLIEALRAECERRGRRHDVALSLDLAEIPPIGKDKALCLFRVAQEALSNVVRHADATNAAVRLRQTDDGLRLTIADDGRGFDPASPASARRLGLVSMRERLQHVDGRLDVESAPGQGTTLVAWVPLGSESS